MCNDEKIRKTTSQRYEFFKKTIVLQIIISLLLPIISLALISPVGGTPVPIVTPPPTPVATLPPTPVATPPPTPVVTPPPTPVVTPPPTPVVTPPPTAVPTPIPCYLNSISANKDSVIQGSAMSFSGYSSQSSLITLTIRGNGLPSSGVILGQVYPSSTTHAWIYVWNPISLSGYSIQAGQYTITATNLCGAQDSLSINIEEGSVTVVASGDQSYYIGETFTFSGTCTQGNSVLLVLTGAGLPSDGFTLANPQKNADNTWSYQWTVPSSIGGYTISSGTYTAYAYDSSRQAYGTVSINLKTQTSPEPTTGFLSITSSPSEANIYIDGVLLGTTPATSTRSFSTGSHTIILRKTGYNDYSTTATVYAGQTTTVNGYLSQIPVSQPAVAQPAYVQPAVAQPAYVQPVSQSNSGSSDPSGLLIFLIIGVVVVVGGYIGYSKIIRSKKEKPPSPPGFTSQETNQMETTKTDKTEPLLDPSSDIPKVEDRLVLQSSSQSTQPATPAKPIPDDDVIKVLKMRYAKGEISTEEYQKMLDHLKK